MKLIITLLILSLVSPVFSAETPAKKKAPAKSAATAAAKKKAAEATPDEASAKSQSIAKTLTPSQETKLLEIINKGDDKALQSLPGIGETRAAAIKKARPVKEPVDLVKIDGIAEGVFADIVAHAKAGFPETAKAEKKEAPAKAKAKSSPKKKAAAPEKK